MSALDRIYKNSHLWETLPFKLRVTFASLEKFMAIDARNPDGLNKSVSSFITCSSLFTVLDPRSQRAGSYKIGAVIVNV